jgi:hypothetical protein
MHSQFLRKPIQGATLALATIVSGSAIAQNFPALSCGQLWYERNSIYSQFGYCFQTDQAIGAFGRGCFPPYGRLPTWHRPA